jgi:hypothetical protein
LHRKIEYKLSGKMDKISSDANEIRIVSHQDLAKEMEKFGEAPR